MPALQEQGFTKAELGFALSAVSIAYGFSKFFMGTVSDRSNAPDILSSWLALTAIVNLLMDLYRSLHQVSVLCLSYYS